MGTRATRITREEFVTPPEFSQLHLPEFGSGRIGGARLELVREGHETRLGGSYQQIPLRVMPPFNFDFEPECLLYLINMTAGLMDGDGHLIELVAREGTRAVVTGQSAARIHPAVKNFATQQYDVRVEQGACLVILPGPTITFQGCRYFQRGRVELAEDARMLWGDIWVAGRYERGKLSERFQFERIVQDFEVRREGRLIFRDRFCWNGPWSRESVDWYFGGHLSSASLFVAGPLPDSLPKPPPSVLRSVFEMGNDVSCVRWCGHPTPVTADLAITALSLAAYWTQGPGASPWLLSSTELAPNHWFSTPVDPAWMATGRHGGNGQDVPAGAVPASVTEPFGSNST